MKIYLIQHDIPKWNANMGHVIIANDEEEVIQYAQDISMSEGSEIWKSDRCSIIILGDYTGFTTRPFIALTDFNAG